MALIAPSLLAADFSRLGEGLHIIKEAGASMVHLDVMDGHFVPEISVGQPVVRSVRKATDLVLDLHLLMERPERYVGEFLEIGTDRIAVHAESTPHLHKVLGMIRSGGAKAGLAINPYTPVEAVSDALGGIDYLLILTADVGFGESQFLPGALGKVQAAGALRQNQRLDFAIQAEGGIGESQVEPLVQAGADILVAGSDIFQKDPKGCLQEMIRRAASSRQVSRV